MQENVLNKKFKKQLVLLAVIILVLGCLLFLGKKSTNRTHVVNEMKKVDLALKNRDIEAIKSHRKALFKIANNLKDKELKQRTIESVALLDAIGYAWSNGEEQALQIIKQRIDANKGEFIYPEAFENSLSEVKIQILNLFFKRLDMQGAYIFTSVYPSSYRGETEENKYFMNLERFVLGDMDGAEKEFEKMLKDNPENKRVKNTLEFITRLRKKGIVPEKTDELKLQLKD